MIRWNRVAVAGGCAVVIAGIALAVTPVTILPSSILPGPLRNLLPPAAQTAELSCGSVANPHDPPGFGGVLASVASAVNIDCTRAVRSRMWTSVWVLLAGIAVILMGVIALRRHTDPVGDDDSGSAESGDLPRTPGTLPPPTLDAARPRVGRTARLAGITTVAALLVLGVAACSDEPERSTAAFCATMKSEQARILAQFNANVDAGNASSDGMVQALSGLGASIQALGELRTYLRKLAIVAPNEIRTDAEIVAQGYDDQLKAAKDALKDPLSAIASSLIDGMMMSGQLNRLNQFALDNCGQSI